MLIIEKAEDKSVIDDLLHEYERSLYGESK